LPELQLVTLRHWSSHQPPQLGLRRPLSTLAHVRSKCSRVVRCRCKACPHHNKKRMMLLRTGQRQLTPGCSRMGHQSRNKTYRNSTCTEQVEPLPELQLVTLRHWSSHQPPQLGLRRPLSTLAHVRSKCSRVVRCRCKACPHHNRRRMTSVSTVQLQLSPGCSRKAHRTHSSTRRK